MPELGDDADMDNEPLPLIRRFFRCPECTAKRYAKHDPNNPTPCGPCARIRAQYIPKRTMAEVLKPRPTALPAISPARPDDDYVDMRPYLEAASVVTSLVESVVDSFTGGGGDFGGGGSSGEW